MRFVVQHAYGGRRCYGPDFLASSLYKRLSFGMVRLLKVCAASTAVALSVGCRDVTSPPITQPSPTVASERPVVFHSYAPGTLSVDLFLAKADGSDVVQLTHTGKAVEPAWSPDGKRVAYFSYVLDVGGAIHVVDADGSNERTVKTGNVVSGYPAWSPDGTRIAFEALDGIDVVDTAGTGYKELPVLKWYGTKVSWSPNGSSIAYACITSSTGSTNHIDICTVNPDTGENLRLTYADRAYTDPSWSPDGKQIAFTSYQQLFIMNGDGSAMRPIITVPTPFEDLRAPVWSRDSKLLMFTGYPQNSSGFAIYSINADGTGNRAILPNGLYADLYHGLP
jgi:Tol biopolymer transport system component